MYCLRLQHSCDGSVDNTRSSLSQAAPQLEVSYDSKKTLMMFRCPLLCSFLFNLATQLQFFLALRLEHFIGDPGKYFLCSIPAIDTLVQPVTPILQFSSPMKTTAWACNMYVFQLQKFVVRPSTPRLTQSSYFNGEKTTQLAES